ncbi:type II methionyl aminopeptidase [Candidatus Woesearchaeota archaeon]|nr:type II methionyl aminopeptidase [Candidatus Woesearchaeota archaeon]
MEQEVLEKLKKAGKIAAEALEFARWLVKPGVLVVEVCDKVEEKIRRLEAEPAFPVQISMNDIAAHFCPESDDKAEFSDQLVSIDVGVHVDGWVGGDTALTIDLSKKNEELVKASRDALNNAIRIIKPGVKLREIGAVIHDTITDYGFSPVRNLSGHGLGEWSVHERPSIPNYDNGDNTELKEDDLIAVEPFATNGAGIIYESSPATVFALVNKKPVRLPMVRRVLKEIEKLNGLPFTTRWLTKKFSSSAKIAIVQMARQDIIKEYPPLIDKNHGLVSQAEHSLIVRDKPIILTKL